MRRIPAALIALTAGSAFLLACCQNPFVPKIASLKALAASPLIGLSAEGGAAIANGGSFGFGDLSIAGKKDQSFVITNSGKSALIIPAASVAITGTDSSCFAVASALPETVPPGGSASFSIRFAPPTVGAKSASLGFSTNDVSNPSFAISLSGTGISQAPTPVIEGGDTQCFPDGQTTVSISCPNSSADIYYTTDGSVPSLSMLGSSTLKYTGSFYFTFETLGQGSVRAMAKIAGMSDSSIATAFFTTTLNPAPTVLPGAMTFLSGAVLPAFTLKSTTDNARIAFTLNGSDPTSNIASGVIIQNNDTLSDLSKIYNAKNGFSFNYAGPHTGGTFTLTETAFCEKKATSGFLCSDITTTTYSFKMSPPTWASVQPSTTYYTSAQSITISCVNGDGGTATITYSTSGSVVTPSGTAYSGAITVPVGDPGSSTEVTIQAIAHQSNWIDSEPLTDTFRICGPGLWSNGTNNSKWDQATWQP
jgi:hypothetical protein